MGLKQWLAWKVIAHKLKRLIRQQPREDVMSWLNTVFDSTKGKGMSKKIIVLFITGTLLPTLQQLGVPDNIITILGQLAAIYLGGQSLADTAHNWKGNGTATPPAA